jgi:uncharacterized membrane protein
LGDPHLRGRDDRRSYPHVPQGSGGGSIVADENQPLNRQIRFVLLTGMVLSLSMMAIGLLWNMISPSSTNVTMGPWQAVQAMLNGDPIGLIDLGIMLLIATPLIRILVALATFIKGKEWKFVAVSLIVLLVITMAILVKA